MIAAAPPSSRPGNPLAALGDLVIVLVEVLLRLAGSLLRQPVIALPLLVAGGGGYELWRRFGYVGPAATVAVLVLAPLAWRVAHGSSFERFCGRHLRNARVRLFRYERRWRAVMLANGLCKTHVSKSGERSELVPRILRVHAGPCVDRVLVRMRNGQEPSLFAAQLVELAHDFDALWVRVRSDARKNGTPRGGRVWLEFQRVDPLVDPIDALPIPDVSDLLAAPVGLVDDGAPWTIRVLGSHFLLIGATRAGKSSWLWSLLRHLAPAIRERRVEVWAADKVGGIELGLGEELLARHVMDDPRALLALLQELNKRMEARARKMAADKVRVHVPTVEEPLILLILDELLAALITAERGLRGKLEGELRRLMTQAAACGISVIAGAQSPLKEVLGPTRDFFTIRVGFRMNSSSHPDATFFEGARAAGARCDEILDSQRGMAFALEDGSGEFRRVRVAFVSTEEILEMAQAYGPGATPSGRLKARLEGRSSTGVPLTAEQQVEVDAILASFRESDAALEDARNAQAEAQPEVERPRSAA